MNRDSLYEIAFRYKKAKLWRKLWDDEIFAVKLNTGEIGYVCIMGGAGEYNSLGLYVGEGFNSYRRMLEGIEENVSAFKRHEIMVSHKTLQLVLDEQVALAPEEVEEVRAYAKKAGIRLSGKNTYPHFIKYEPRYYPWKVKTEEDMQNLYTALEVAVFIAEALSTKTPQEMGIHTINFDKEEVACFTVEDGKLINCGSIPLPEDTEEKYEYAEAKDEIALETLKKLPQKGIWETELVCLREPVQDDPEEAPYYPWALMVVESKSGYVLHVPILSRPEIEADKMLRELAQAWERETTCPKEIRCRDERTYALLKDLCEKVGIKIRVYTKKMNALDEAETAFFNSTREVNDVSELFAEMDAIIEMILTADKKELKLMPKPLIEEFKMLIAQDVFPDDLAKELSKKLNGL